jgi:hypothetical protein
MINNLTTVDAKRHVYFDLIILFLLTWMPNGISIVSNLCNILGDMSANWHNVVNKLSTHLANMGVHDLQLGMFMHKFM